MSFAGLWLSAALVLVAIGMVVAAAGAWLVTDPTARRRLRRQWWNGEG